MAEEAGASKKPKKYTGILLHPTSLPGPYGIGELGASAYRFVDFLERSGLNTWQVLPHMFFVSFSVFLSPVYAIFIMIPPASAHRWYRRGS